MPVSDFIAENPALGKEVNTEQHTSLSILVYLSFFSLTHTHTQNLQLESRASQTLFVLESIGKLLKMLIF